MTQKSKKQKEKPIHYYSVDLWCFASQEEKEKAERAERDEESMAWVALPGKIKAITFYYGKDRQKAIRRFFKAAEAAMVEPLSYRLRMQRDTRDVLIDLLVKLPYQYHKK
ncbi:MAG TPA: hypothetical protein VHV10_02975 [Ktedonobacteraceae bacterium]|jgi:hypothetical protein|nr:hypothetical protein [Ktedonobacteraceae bacterium]